jgi:hypothetical protein
VVCDGGAGITAIVAYFLTGETVAALVIGVDRRVHLARTEGVCTGMTRV